MGEGLIAENEGKGAGEGGGVALDLYNLGHDLASDGVGWESGIDTAMVAVDYLSSALNPLGALISAGVGWLIEHIPGISDIWDKLMGDAAAIEQIAQTWDNISRSLNSNCQQLVQASNQIERWSGSARDSYTKVAQAFESSVQGASVESEALAIVVRLIGGICSGLKDFAYEKIADFIEFTVIPAILSALATAWCTFGGSVAAAITYIEIQADISAGEITLKITHVSEEIVVLGERATKIVAKLEKMKSTLKELDELVKANANLARDLATALAHGGLEQGRAVVG